MKTIDFGTSKKEIIKIARETGAKYVIEWHDHYRGNAKGFYRTVDEFEKSNYFSWIWGMDDRGAISVILTDADVPTLIEERKEIVRKLENLRFEYKSAYDKAASYYGGTKRIDGRWSVNNPKYIEAKEHNDIILKYAESVKCNLEHLINKCKKQLNECNLVSSTMWHCEL